MGNVSVSSERVNTHGDPKRPAPRPLKSSSAPDTADWPFSCAASIVGRPRRSNKPAPRRNGGARHAERSEASLGNGQNLSQRLLWHRAARLPGCLAVVLPKQVDIYNPIPTMSHNLFYNSKLRLHSILLAPPYCPFSLFPLFPLSLLLHGSGPADVLRNHDERPRRTFALPRVALGPLFCKLNGFPRATIPP